MRLELVLNGEGHDYNSSGRHMQVHIAVVVAVITMNISRRRLSIIAKANATTIR